MCTLSRSKFEPCFVVRRTTGAKFVTVGRAVASQRCERRCTSSSKNNLNGAQIHVTTPSPVHAPVYCAQRLLLLGFVLCLSLHWLRNVIHAEERKREVCVKDCIYYLVFLNVLICGLLNDFLSSSDCICGLPNDFLSSSDCAASNGRPIELQRLCRGSGRGQIWGTVLGKTTKDLGIVCIRAEIWNRGLPNTKQEFKGV
jgi:hypothetical protein